MERTTSALAPLRAHPWERHSIPKDDAWSLSTGQLRSNWGFKSMNYMPAAWLGCGSKMNSSTLQLVWGKWNTEAFFDNKESLLQDAAQCVLPQFCLVLLKIGHPQLKVNAIDTKIKWWQERKAMMPPTLVGWRKWTISAEIWTWKDPGQVFSWWNGCVTILLLIALILPPNQINGRSDWHVTKQPFVLLGSFVSAAEKISKNGLPDHHHDLQGNRQCVPIRCHFQQNFDRFWSAVESESLRSLARSNSSESSQMTMQCDAHSCFVDFWSRAQMTLWSLCIIFCTLRDANMWWDVKGKRESRKKSGLTWLGSQIFALQQWHDLALLQTKSWEKCNALICLQCGCMLSVLMRDSQGRDSFTEDALLSMSDQLLLVLTLNNSEEHRLRE